MPSRSDLCFATTNRQAALARDRRRTPTPSSLLVRRTRPTPWRLAKIAEAAGCPRVLRVNSAAELPDDLEGTVAVTAGASAPESLVNEVLRLFDPSERRDHKVGHGRRRVLSTAARNFARF